MILNLLESTLIDFKSEVRKLWPEHELLEGRVDERFSNAELSHVFQIKVASSELNGKITFQPGGASQDDFFDLERKNGQPSSPDIGIRLNESRYNNFEIEGKRLSDKNDNQYVSGRTGGIVRFKREKHGKHTAKACMVGYMESESSSFWHQRINGWVANEKANSTDLNWLDTESLSEPFAVSTTLARCFSQHQRITKPPIELHHFWVDMR